MARLYRLAAHAPLDRALADVQRQFSASHGAHHWAPYVLFGG